MQTVLDALTGVVCQIYADRLVSLVVFGSVARGVATPRSDIDILLVADRLPVGRIKRVREFEQVEMALEKSGRNAGIDLSPVFKEPSEVLQGSPLFYDMTREVLILHDTSDFFLHYLASLRDRLAQLGAYRVELGSAWYWVLKKEFSPGEVFTV